MHAVLDMLSKILRKPMEKRLASLHEARLIRMDGEH